MLDYVYMNLLNTEIVFSTKQTINKGKVYPVKHTV